jgi:hypothetical protein
MLPAVAREHHHGRAFRRRELVCGRVELTVVRDEDRLGLAVRERSYVVARFIDELHPELRNELRKLVRGRGARAKRIADALEPVELLFTGSDGAERSITARIEPPQVRHGALRKIEFKVRRGNACRRISAPSGPRSRAPSASSEARHSPTAAGCRLPARSNPHLPPPQEAVAGSRRDRRYR